MLVELKRQRQHHGDGADLDRTVAPQHQRQRARTGDEQRVEHVEHRGEHREQALRGEKQIDVAVDRVAHILVLFGRAREQLDGEDVGVAVDDAPHQGRARYRADFRALAHVRHEIEQHRGVAGKPQQDRQRQPAVGRGGERDGGSAIDQNVPDRGDGRGQRRAHRRPGLHHAVGNPAGEVVLKERPALAHHVPMRLPANEAGERRGDRLIGDEVADQRHRRPHDHHHDRHAEQPGPALAEKPVGRRLGHHGDDAAHEPRHRAVGERDAKFHHEQGREQPLGLTGKVPQKADQSGRRLGIFRRRRRRQELLEKCEHLRMVTGAA